jgi:hypothetical protein
MMEEVRPKPEIPPEKKGVYKFPDKGKQQKWKNICRLSVSVVKSVSL